jgi:hypothetical protein
MSYNSNAKAILALVSEFMLHRYSPFYGAKTQPKNKAGHTLSNLTFYNACLTISGWALAGSN